MEACFWVFAIMGFVELLVKIASLFFVYGKSELEDVSILISVSEKEERLEYILRSLQNNLEGLRTKRGGADIYLIDLGMDQDTFMTAASLCDDYDNVFLCHKEEIPKILEKK
jgi:hypothetical protein